MQGYGTSFLRGRRLVGAVTDPTPFSPSEEGSMTVPCPVADRRRLSGVPWKEGAPVAAANSICSSVLDVTHLLLF